MNVGAGDEMKRKDRIYQYVKDNTEDLSQEELEFGGGLTTSEISEALEIVRTNVSKELNLLVREGHIIKLEGRPVRYVDKGTQQWKPLTKKVVSYKETNLLSKNKEKQISIPKSSNDKDLFDYMIGSKGSLKNQVEQAKAALFYPPKGLNSLIIGPTGSGKTFFANAMYQYSQNKEIIEENQAMIVFNCADYSQNPQLLMSHLFGHVKGAFTGASEAKDGLLMKANNNMLFLDEIHRLPPEGQEMLFYFMDNGTFQKMGDTGEKVSSNVRIVCATTENPESALLSTFVRRIPITIQLPAFSERPAKEKIQLLKLLLSIEAKRINKEIIIDEDAVKSLLGSVTYGNIGQLKSNIQLACAKGFLNSMDNSNEIHITMEALTASIKEGLVHLAKNRTELNEISKYLEPRIKILPKDSIFVNHEDAYELPYNLYEIIGDKAALLKAEGLDKEHINNFITTDINLHLKSFYKQNQMSYNKESNLTDIVDDEVITLTKEIRKLAEKKLNYQFQDNFLYAMSLHLSSFIKRAKEGDLPISKNDNLEELIVEYQDEYQVALMIKEHIYQKYQMDVPEVECWYLTMLLASLKQENTAGRVGIVVAAHGKSTASSMVQVVSKLLSANNIHSVDMPLEMNPHTAFDLVKDQVIAVDEGNGVMLLVDMGSLSTFGPRITEETGIQVRTIDMVTTPVVLEAARKTSLIDNDLISIFDSLKQFRGYSTFLDFDPEELPEKDLLEFNKPKAIITICSTGEGTAKQIKEIIEAALESLMDDSITVIPLSLIDVDQTIQNLAQEYQIIATTGVVKPTLDVPFIPLDELIQGGGADRIRDLVGANLALESTQVVPILTKELCEDYMKGYFTFINPHKVIDVLWDYCQIVAEEKNQTFSNSFIIGLVMHIAGAIERTLLNDTMAVVDEMDNQASDYYDAVIKANQSIKTKLNIDIPEAENYYILQIFETEKQK
ncbi:transcriptional regulator [Carnobacterium divergens DSM 20623]|uniref:Transcriptional regulator n=2 Tax=Carnobacterium divergens TaxID=2748 RepID=A0A0R2HWT5_CARDV|nr:transcriptional regulator [Carnobacterium divergens DSM 20623]